MKKILFSGFEPFGNDVINPSLEAVKLLGEKKIPSIELLTVQTPVVRFKSIDVVIEAIKFHQPDIVVTVGQAGGRIGITPERVAINVDDFRIKDNEGNQPIDEIIAENGPDAYFSTLPIKAIMKKLQDNEVPSSVSNSAGTFVCNHLFYGVQHFIKTNNLDIKHGFVHIPLIPQQAPLGDKPTMDLNLIVKGLELLAISLKENEKDIKLEAGTIC